MASRDFLKHVVSTSEPVGSALGDEYYNPSSNKLYKQLAVNGTSVQWVERQQALTVQSSGVTRAVGARTINFPGATIAYDSTTDTLTIQSSGIPGGSDTHVQFNSVGGFAGSSNLTWNGSLLNVTGRIETNGSRVVDYKNTTAQWAMSGGGLVTWTGASVLWNTRVICIPVENNEMGSSGHFDITCPTSGTVVYYNSANVTTTLTATAAGIPLAAWEALYYEVTEGMSSAFDQTRFRVVNYQNTTWRPSTGWLLVAAVNGDGNNVGHLKWLPGQVNLPTTGATVTYNTGTGVASWASATGTVTSVSVVSANGFAGTVATASSTPAITLSTSITGLLKGNGTAISAATAGTDYQTAQSVTGIVKSSGTTRSAATAGTDYQSPIGTISGIAKGNGANALTAATAGTDYVAPSGTFFIGTTSIAHNRASASLSMTGVNIDGSAGTFTSTSQNSQFNSVGVGVAAVANAGQLTLSNGALATTLNAISNPHISIRSTQSNSSFLDISAVRDLAGTDWTTAGTRIQMKIDTTFQAYMQFNGSSANYGIEWGSGSSVTATGVPARMRLDSAGSLRVLSNVTSTSTTSGTVIVTGGVGMSENLYVGGLMVQGGLYSSTTRQLSIVLGTETWVRLGTFTNRCAIKILIGAGSSNSEEESEIEILGTYTLAGTQIHVKRQTYNPHLREVRVTQTAGGAPKIVYVRLRTTEFAPNIDWRLVKSRGVTSIENVVETPGAGESVLVEQLNANINNAINTLTNTTASTSTTTGALVVTGGAGISGDVYTGGQQIQSIATGLTAAGTTQGTALLLAKQINNVTVVAASSGVRLPVAVAGMRIIVRNSSVTNLNVYPNTGAQIQTLGANVAMVLVAATMLEYVAVSTTQWHLMNNVYA